MLPPPKQKKEDNAELNLKSNLFYMYINSCVNVHTIVLKYNIRSK